MLNVHPFYFWFVNHQSFGIRLLVLSSLIRNSQLTTKNYWLVITFPPNARSVSVAGCNPVAITV